MRAPSVIRRTKLDRRMPGEGANMNGDRTMQSLTERHSFFCSRCNQLVLEFYASPDGHFGIARLAGSEQPPGTQHEVQCPRCRARYRLLDRLNGTGQPVERV